MSIGKPKFTASIVTVKANEDIPEALLLKLCQENQSALGLLVRNGTKLDYDKFGIGKQPMDVTPEATFAFLKGILRAQRKFPRMLTFHSLPAEFDEGEVQPYFLKDPKGNILLAIGFEGDFPGRDIDGSSEMYGLMNEYLGPKVDEVFKFCNNQINKTVNWLKGDSFANDLKNTYSHRAEFVFFPNEGDPFAIGKNEIGLVSNWGTCSNAYGYTEAAIEAATLEAKPEPVPARSKFASTEEPVAAQVDDKGIHHIQEAPKPETTPPQVDAPIVTDPIVKAAAATVEGHWETPPATVRGGELKKWYRSMYAKMGEMDASNKLGRLPEDWDKRPRVFIKTQTTVKSLSDLSQTAIGTTVSENANLPVISGSDQAKINDYIKKYTSDKVVDNPLDLQKQESKLAVFSELSLKGGLDEINRWPVSFINGLCRTHPEAAWLLIVELRRKVINLQASLKAGDKTLGELAGTNVHTPATPVVTEPLTPSAPAEHAPRKISKYA